MIASDYTQNTALRSTHHTPQTTHLNTTPQTAQTDNRQCHDPICAGVTTTPRYHYEYIAGTILIYKMQGNTALGSTLPMEITENSVSPYVPLGIDSDNWTPRCTSMRMNTNNHHLKPEICLVGSQVVLLGLLWYGGGMNKKRGKHKKAVDCVTADEKIVGELLNEDEWEQFECKEANAKPSDLLKAVVAMVNTSGGILIIGLKDAKNAKGKKRLIGIGMHRNNISQFLVKITNIQPQLNEPCEERYIPIKNIHGHSDEILVLDIKKGKQVHALDGNTYVRRGSSSIKIGPSEIRNLEIDRGVVKFEDEISNVSELDDLDHDLLDRYKEDTKTSQDNQSILRSIGLIKEKDSKEYLIEAGILLFGKEPVVSLRRKVWY